MSVHTCRRLPNRTCLHVRTCLHIRTGPWHVALMRRGCVIILFSTFLYPSLPFHDTSRLPKFHRIPPMDHHVIASRARDSPNSVAILSVGGRRAPCGGESILPPFCHFINKADEGRGGGRGGGRGPKRTRRIGKGAQDEHVGRVGQHLHHLQHLKTPQWKKRYNSDEASGGLGRHRRDSTKGDQVYRQMTTSRRRRA